MPDVPDVPVADGGPDSAMTNPSAPGVPVIPGAFPQDALPEPAAVSAEELPAGGLPVNDPLVALSSPDESVVMKAAVAQVRVLTRAAAWHRRYIAILAFSCAVLIAVVAVLGYLLHQQDAITHQQAALNTGLRQDAINACETGNSFRAAQQRIWDDFIALAIAGKHDPKTLATARSFSAYVAKTDAPNNCQRIYGAH